MYALQSRIRAYVGEQPTAWETIDNGTQRAMDNKARCCRAESGGAAYGGEREYRVVPAIGSRRSTTR